MEERWARIKADHGCQVVPATWWPKSKAQLEAESPSRLDGLSPTDEFYLRRGYCELLAEGGKRLKMCVHTCSTLWPPHGVLLLAITSGFDLWGQVADRDCHSGGHLPPLLCHQVHAPQRLLRASLPPATCCQCSKKKVLITLPARACTPSRAVCCPERNTSRC
jgi:hypothetical protein